jgi:DNA topoisomerase IB
MVDESRALFRVMARHLLRVEHPTPEAVRVLARLEAESFLETHARTASTGDVTSFLRESALLRDLVAHAPDSWGLFHREFNAALREPSHVRVARQAVAKSFKLDVGMPVLYGKYKNKKGIIKSFKTGPKGDPIVVIEQVPNESGRKQDKELKLFKIRYDKARAQEMKRKGAGANVYDWGDYDDVGGWQYVIQGEFDDGLAKAHEWGMDDNQWEQIEGGDGPMVGIVGGAINDLDWFVSQHNEDLFYRHPDNKDGDWSPLRTYFDKTALAARIAAKYQNKKKVKTQDGDEATVYEYSEGQVQHRNREKAKRIEKLRKSIDKLRSQVTKDLGSKDPDVRLTALAVALMDETYERVGNEGSAKEGHYGVTGWKVKHVKFSGSKATLSYVGKSGVKQTKTVTNAMALKVLKDAVKGKDPDEEILCEGDDCRITAEKVNAYLKPFDVTAKDLRGLHANEEMKSRLKAQRKGKLPTDKKERESKLKEEFKAALEAAAEAVGHEPSTLKSQYLVPGLEDAYLKDGTVPAALDKTGSLPLREWLPGFFQRHPALRAYRGIPMQEGTGGSQEASTKLGKIIVYPKFWALPDKTQDFVLAHEIGHWVLGEYGLSKLIRVAVDLGLDLWDTPSLPFGQYNSDEAFADSFASYHTDKDVQRRYPEWASLVEVVKTKVKTATKTHAEREDEEAERLVRPSPKKKPPRKDLRRERMETDKDQDDDKDQDRKDQSQNYKDIGASLVMRVAFQHLRRMAAEVPEWAKGQKYNNPDTGEKVDFGSLPEKEQEKLRAQHDEGGAEDEGGDKGKPSPEEQAAEQQRAEEEIAKAQQAAQAAADLEENLDAVEDVVKGLGGKAKSTYGDFDEKQQEAVADAYGDAIDDLVMNPPTSDKDIAELAGLADAAPGPGVIDNPEKLGEFLARQNYAKRVVTNPMMVGTQAVSDDNEAPEGGKPTKAQIDASQERAEQAYQQYNAMSAEQRREAFFDLNAEYLNAEPGSPRHTELRGLVNGVAFSMAMAGDDVPYMASVPESFGALGAAMQKANPGSEMALLSSVTSLPSVQSRQVVERALAELDEETLFEVAGGNTGPMGDWIRSLTTGTETIFEEGEDGEEVKLQDLTASARKTLLNEFQQRLVDTMTFAGPLASEVFGGSATDHIPGAGRIQVDFNNPAESAKRNRLKWLKQLHKDLAPKVQSAGSKVTERGKALWTMLTSVADTGDTGAIDEGIHGPVAERAGVATPGSGGTVEQPRTYEDYTAEKERAGEKPLSREEWEQRGEDEEERAAEQR